MTGCQHFPAACCARKAAAGALGVAGGTAALARQAVTGRWDRHRTGGFWPTAAGLKKKPAPLNQSLLPVVCASHRDLYLFKKTADAAGLTSTPLPALRSCTPLKASSDPVPVCPGQRSANSSREQSPGPVRPRHRSRDVSGATRLEQSRHAAPGPAPSSPSPLPGAPAASLPAQLV